MKILGATRTPILMSALLFILLRLIPEIDLHLVLIFPLSPTVVAVPVIVINSLKVYLQRNRLYTAPHFLKEKDPDVMIIMTMWGPRENLMSMTTASRITNCRLGLSLLKGDRTDSMPTSVLVLPIVTEKVPTTDVANRSVKVIGN